MSDSNPWALIAETTTTLESLADTFEVTLPCTHPDQAVDIAEYMVVEIQTNAQSDQAKRMIENNTYSANQQLKEWREETNKQNSFVKLLRHAAQPDFYQIQLAAQGAALLIWTERVAQNHPWDHKPKIAQQFPTQGHSTRYHHKYKRFEYYYDIWSNIHYGYMGAYCQFSESVLLDGAGLEQIGTDVFRGQSPTNRSTSNGSGLRQYDDTTDHLSVRIGISLYKQYPAPTLLTAQILLDEIEAAPYPIKEGSKQIHKCYK